MWFKVAINKLAADLLPTFLRKPRLVAFLGALLYPAQKLHEAWVQLRADNLYKLEHTGQVASLTQVLNDRLDPEQRRIHILGAPFEHSYLYLPVEKKPMYLGKLFTYRRMDYADNSADFTVYVPQSLFEDQWFALSALLDFYKLASKRYKIKTL